MTDTPTSDDDAPPQEPRGDRPTLDLRDDRGAQAMEYAMLAGAAVVIILVLMQIIRSEFFTGMIQTLITNVIDRVIDAIGGGGGTAAAPGPVADAAARAAQATAATIPGGATTAVADGLAAPPAFASVTTP